MGTNGRVVLLAIEKANHWERANKVEGEFACTNIYIYIFFIFLVYKA